MAGRLGTATLGVTQLTYLVEGPDDGPPLVLINSLGTDHRMWDRQITDFARDHRVIRYDTRGQGATPAPVPPYTLEQLGADVVGLLDHLDVDRAHVCGVSLGGLVSLWLSVNHPQRLLSATFANTAARIGTKGGWNDRIAAVADGGMASIREIVLERFFSAGFRSRDLAAVASIGRTLQDHEPRGYVGACAALRDADLRDEVSTIDVPALVIGASADVSTPPEDARWLAERIANASYLELEGAGHLSNIECPEQFNSAVLEHLGASP